MDRQTSEKERKKERKSTYNFSSMLGLLNLAVPRNLGVHHMHGTMIPCHDIWSFQVPNHRATQSISDSSNFQQTAYLMAKYTMCIN
jgi:hypothetical protein